MELYKAGQGTRARALAAIAAGLLVLFGVSEMFALSQPWNYIFSVLVCLVIGGGGLYFAFFQKRTVNFLVDTQAEMKKVAWPPKAEVRGSTVVVITTVVLMSAFLYFVDLLLGRIVQWIGIIPEIKG